MQTQIDYISEVNSLPWSKCGKSGGTLVLFGVYAQLHEEPQHWPDIRGGGTETMVTFQHNLQLCHLSPLLSKNIISHWHTPEAEGVWLCPCDCVSPSTAVTECVICSRCLGNHLQRPGPSFQQDPPTERACPTNGWQKGFMEVFYQTGLAFIVCVYTTSPFPLREHFLRNIELMKQVCVRCSLFHYLLLQQKEISSSI